MQRKETENPRYSEKREGCNSGEFYLSHFSLRVIAVTLKPVCNSIFLIIVQTHNICFFAFPVVLLNAFIIFFSQNLCFADNSVRDEHFNTPSPTSQPWGPIQNWIHQKHSTSLWLWLFTGKTFLNYVSVTLQHVIIVQRKKTVFYYY